MKKKDREYIILSAIVGVFFSVLTYITWLFFYWYSLLIVLPGVIVLELLILRWIDKKYVIKEKQKLIQLGLVSTGEYQINSGGAGSEIEQFKNFIRLNLADLNELLLSLEEAYRESLLKLDKGEIEDAKFQFVGVSKDLMLKLHEIEQEVESFIEEFPVPVDKQQKFIFNSYREQWISEKQKKLQQIKDIDEKFQVRGQFSVHLEDILRFEVEKRRPINDSDIRNMKFPHHQAKQLIKFIEKPINLKLDGISDEKKQKYGKLGRMIIENCSKKQITPSLPYLVIELGIAILEAKKILTYLFSVGMVEDIFYHYAEKKKMPG